MKTEKKHGLLALALTGLLLIGAGCAAKVDTNIKAGADEGRPAGETMKDDGDEQKGEVTGEGSGSVKLPDAEVNANVNAAVNVNVGTSGDVKVFKVVGKKFTFSPAEIRVKMGDKVRLEVTSDDDDHGIAIPAFNVNVKFAPGKPAVAEFVADKKGSYPFFCSVFCGSGHRDMKGTLIVE